MRLIRKWSGSKQEFSVHDAIVEGLTADPYYGGVAEQAYSQAESNTTFLGRIVEVLHDKGLLEDREIISLLGDRYERAEDA